jgi:hypothetical protein
MQRHFVLPKTPYESVGILYCQGIDIAVPK